MHEESASRRKVDDDVQEGAVPAYLIDRENTTRMKVNVSELGLVTPADKVVWGSTLK